MKPIKPPEYLKGIIEELENKKSNNTINVNMSSKIIGYSKLGSPSYFLRADYFKDRSLSHDPQEYWSIPNPYEPYFSGCKSKIENMTSLIETEKKMNIKTSTPYYLKKIKDRYDFLIQSRRISSDEITERTNNDWIQFIIRD